MAELSGQGPLLQHGATSIVDTVAGNKLGFRATDTDGNIYVYVDFQEAMLPGEWCVINGSTFAASQIAATSLGFIGVVVATVSASDRYGWVQIYGYYATAAVSSGSSVGPVVLHSTAVGSLASAPAGTGGVGVFGVSLVGAPDTCASTGVGLTDSGVSAVYLNFPFVTGANVAASS
jgi:hypothetical protein